MSPRGFASPTIGRREINYTSEGSLDDIALVCRLFSPFDLQAFSVAIYDPTRRYEGGGVSGIRLDYSSTHILLADRGNTILIDSFSQSPPRGKQP